MLIQGTDELLSLPSTTETRVKMQSPRGLTVRTVGAHVPACGSDPRPLLKFVLGGVLTFPFSSRIQHWQDSPLATLHSSPAVQCTDSLWEAETIFLAVAFETLPNFSRFQTHRGGDGQGSRGLGTISHLPKTLNLSRSIYFLLLFFCSSRNRIQSSPSFRR